MRLPETMPNTNFLSGVKTLWYKNIQFFLSLEEPSPHIQAFVQEQDTAMVLEPFHTITYPAETTQQLIHQAIGFLPQTPGSVLVKTGHPLQFIAIIHNFDEEPTWQEAWIEQALFGILQEAEQRCLSAIALPLLGTVHGTLAATRFFVFLKKVLEQTKPVYLKQLWLIPHDRTTFEQFEKLCEELEDIFLDTD